MRGSETPWCPRCHQQGSAHADVRVLVLFCPWCCNGLSQEGSLQRGGDTSPLLGQHRVVTCPSVPISPAWGPGCPLLSYMSPALHQPPIFPPSSPFLLSLPGNWVKGTWGFLYLFLYIFLGFVWVLFTEHEISLSPRAELQQEQPQSGVGGSPRCAGTNEDAAAG